MPISLPRITTMLLVLASVPAGICAAQSIPSTAAGRFSALDTNGDGAVRKDEFNSDKLFAVMDSNRNSRITPAELQAMLGPLGEGMLSAADRIRLADRNGNGYLDHEELRRSAEMRFQRLDSNQDGKVDREEFTAGFGRP